MNKNGRERAEAIRDAGAAAPGNPAAGDLSLVDLASAVANGALQTVGVFQQSELPTVTPTAEDSILSAAATLPMGHASLLGSFLPPGVDASALYQAVQSFLEGIDAGSALTDEAELDWGRWLGAALATGVAAGEVARRARNRHEQARNKNARPQEANYPAPENGFGLFLEGP